MSAATQPRPAPVVLAAYARPDHVRRTLEALAANHGAADTDVFVYCDGARGEQDREAVLATRTVIGNAAGFRSISIVERETNIGLAQNIILAVTEIVVDRGQVIVLEDDIVTSPGFLQFMNQALDQFRDRPEVWHISGWNYPIETSGLDDAFFLRVMNCWGWATWSDRWQHFQRAPEALVKAFSPSQRRAFNLDGAHDFFAQIESNVIGTKVTWAIFWYAAIFLRGGLCLNPARSLVQNIGFDGTGENCGIAPIAQSSMAGSDQLSLPHDIEESALAVQRIQKSFIYSITF